MLLAAFFLPSRERQHPVLLPAEGDSLVGAANDEDVGIFCIFACMKEKLLGMTLQELKAAAQGCGLKPFVGAQLADWLYAKRATSWDRMVNISKAAREALAEKYDLGVSAPVGSAISSDGTKKYLFEVHPERKSPAPSTNCNQQNYNQIDKITDNCSVKEVASVTNLKEDSVVVDNSKNTGLDEEGKNTGKNWVDNGERGDGQGVEYIESVMIPEEERRTLCVSSQAGCRMGCKFCMTGRHGFHGQLDAAEILNQFLSIDEAGELSNAVFMGMGEPMDNYDAVSRALEVLTAPWGFAWSPKRVTVSTIGVVPVLKRFLEEERCHLAVSLHNPFPEERLSLMPAQKAWDIREIIDLIRQYDFSGQRRVSFEYTMFAGFNDDKRHADALIRLLRGLECRVNLIRFHRIPDFPYDCASDAVMEAFRDRLNNHQILCTIRSSRGEDILAACGMLAGQHAASD